MERLRQRYLNLSRTLSILTVVFLLLLLVSNLFAWRRFRLQAEKINLLTEENRTLQWQAERLYLACQESENCRQEHVQPPGAAASDLRATNQGILVLWFVCQAMLIPLWFVVILSYRKLGQRYESLEFECQNLRETLRRCRR